jgi:xanthine phosphoribosyltransferase
VFSSQTQNLFDKADGMAINMKEKSCKQHLSISTPLRSILFLMIYLHSTDALQVLTRFHAVDARQNLMILEAKKSKKQPNRASRDFEDINRWYESVRSDATPDSIFWEEMERQRLQNQLAEGSSLPNLEDTVSIDTTTVRSISSTASSFLNFQNTISNISPTIKTTMVARDSSTVLPNVEKSRESTLLEYSAFAVSENWLSDSLVTLFGSKDDDWERDELTIDDQNQMIEMERQSLLNDDENDDVSLKSFDDAWMTDAEPWDLYGQPKAQRADRALRIKPDPSNEYTFSPDRDTDYDKKIEKDWVSRMWGCTVHSKRLEKARNNEKAQAFFRRQPDAIEGYDRMWVAAVDSACYQNLVGVFRNYGVQFADNFGDFMYSSDADNLLSIEDVASFKARKVFEITGLPVITAQTSFEVEPIPPPIPGGVVPRSQNPLVSSGYRFNNIGMHVDHIIEALKPVSDPKRVCRYRSCLCFYDGEMEFYEFSCLDCDIHWATSLRTYIPMNQGINQICKTLQLTFGLEYMKWLKTSQAEATSRFGNAVTQLRDRVLKDGRVLPNDIIDVSAFMDSMVDVNLMDDCAKELSERFKDMKPSKILTVATTGLVIALPMAKYLQVPVVYARKERNVVMADTYKANYSSKTVGKNRELLVSKTHILEDDRVLIVDDFLSSGASQDALLRIVSEAGAESVGIGVLLEKVYDSGRLSLSGFNVPVESLCRVASVQGGVIQLLEEDGFELM